MILGSADILLTDLLALLTSPGRPAPDRATRPRPRADHRPAPSPGRAAHGRRPASPPHPAHAGRGHRDAPVDRGNGHPQHPRRPGPALHERALAMRLRRFEQQRGSYDDLLDIPRHLAALTATTTSPASPSRPSEMLPGTLATVAYLAEIEPADPPRRAGLDRSSPISNSRHCSTPGTCPPPPASWRRSISRSRPAPPPTLPTPNGSATCPSATTGSGRSRPRPGT